MKFKYMENRVIEILNTYPEAKDDDNLLLCHYLKSYKDDFTTSNTDFADWIVTEKIATLFKTMERVRRKVQAMYPDLRGKAWHKRHEIQKDFIKYAIE